MAADMVHTMLSSRLPAAGTASGRQGPAEEGDAELRAACAKMETLFVHYLLKEMRKAVPENGLVSGGRGEKLYTEMHDFELARRLSAGPGLGLGRMLYRQLAETSAPPGEKG